MSGSGSDRGRATFFKGAHGSHYELLQHLGRGACKPAQRTVPHPACASLCVSCFTLGVLHTCLQMARYGRPTSGTLLARRAKRSPSRRSTIVSCRRPKPSASCESCVFYATSPTRTSSGSATCWTRRPRATSRTYGWSSTLSTSTFASSSRPRRPSPSRMSSGSPTRSSPRSTTCMRRTCCTVT